MDFKLEERIKELLKETMSKKGAKHVRKLLDDIMNERPLNVSKDLKQELEQYSTDTLRLIVEKNILLSLENSSLANRKSYWDVLKDRAPRIKVGIISHYYDNYINDLKQDNPPRYQARTITELTEAYDKVINENLAIFSDTAETVISSINSVDVAATDNKNEKDISINGKANGKLVIDKKAKISTGKFINEKEFTNLLNNLEKTPSRAQLMISNPNLSVQDLKVITSSLSNKINIVSNDDTKVVTLGQAGVKEAGTLENAELPDGSYISMDELTVAINKYLNKPKEEKKPLKVVSIKQHIRRQTAILAMSAAVLLACLPTVRNKVTQSVIPAITQEVNNFDTDSFVSSINDQVNNVLAGAQNVQTVVQNTLEQSGVTQAVTDVYNTVQETVDNIVNPQVVASVPVEETIPEMVQSVEPTVPVTETQDVVPTEETIVTEEVAAPIEQEVEEQPVEEAKEEVVEEVIEETPVEELVVDTDKREATKDDFNFRHEDSNILAAKARNMGFTDEQILIAVGISRYETGNYEHLAGGYNYGGVTGEGDAGYLIYDNHKYARYTTKDKGMDAFLANLKENYFDVGRTTVASISKPYTGQADPSHWINNVIGCMEKEGLNPGEIIVASADQPQETVTEVVEQPIDEVTEEKTVEETTEEQPVEENVEEVNEEPVEEVKEEIDAIETYDPIQQKYVKIENSEIENTSSNMEEQPVEETPVEETGVEETTEEVAPVEEKVEETTEEEKISEVDEIRSEKIMNQKASVDIEDNNSSVEVTEPINEVVETPVEVAEPIPEQQPILTPANEVSEVKQEQIVVNQIIQDEQSLDANTAAALGMTLEQLDVVKATIRHEAGNNPAEIANVASCVRNRMVSRGLNAYQVITAPGQFESYLKGRYKKYTGGNYYQGDPATLAQVNAMLDGILAGTTPPTHGYENFRSASSPKGVQLAEGGNKYR